MEEIFHRYQQNEEKESFQRYQEAVKKISQLKSQTLQTIIAKFDPYNKFMGNIIELRERRRRGIGSC